MNRFLVLDVDIDLAAQTGLERFWYQAGASPYLEVGAGYAGHLTGLLQGLEQKRVISRIRRFSPDGQGRLQSENLSLRHVAGIAVCENTFADDAFVCKTLGEVLCHSAAMQTDKADAGSMIPMRLQRLLAWIELRLSEPIGVTEMAKITAQSESALFAAFQKHLGTTPMRWLGEQRLQRAYAMLNDPKNTMPLGDIAREVGFTDQSAFSRAFSRRFGHAPIALRRRT
jgi:transcriptional regulator GlxA family with amidase domain